VDIREKTSLLPGSCAHPGHPPALGVSLPTCAARYRERLIGEARHLQPLTGRRHPDHHRAVPVQIQPDNLAIVVPFAHRGLLRRGSEHPESHSGRQGSGGPAPSSHQFSGAVDITRESFRFNV
jgi:hypothetical protein